MVKDIVTDILILKRKSVPADKDDRQLFTDLCDTLAANSDRCVGMAANMIGVHKTVLAAQIGNSVTLMVNPVITDHSKDMYEVSEGCLSLTGERTTKRWQVITVEYLDKNFKKKKKTLRGFEAQIVQHEMDHFEGIII
ncbi:MAG: peptide deformylase [Ruminococcus sp.]|nr:peptide deformylase [Ruminococcus sp.]